MPLSELLKKQRSYLRKLLSILILIFSATISYSQDNSADSVRIPLVLTDEGHTIVKATVNGVEGNFIFDTGAGLNMLTKKFADTIDNLEKTDGFHTGYRATGEKIQTDMWKADRLQIGSYELKNEWISVVDVDFPIDGLISLTAFKDVPVTIDYKNKALIIETDESTEKRMKQAKSVIPIQILKEQGKTLDISTYIRLGDELKLQVKLDSGAGFDVYRFNSRYMEALGIDSSKVDHEYQKSTFRPEEGNDYYYTKISEMSTPNGKNKIHDLEATFIDGLIYEGIMGVNWLGDKITIDVANKRLIVE